MLRLLASMLSIAAVAAATPAVAQEFPTRPVTIVVPFSPGSGTDTGARILSEYLAPALGQPLVIDNRPGASGAIAAGAVARADADGYTLLMGTNTTHSANPNLIRDLAYDPVEDFRPVGLVATFAAYLAVHPDVPAQTVEELIELARENPGQLTYATGNVTSLIMGEVFKSHLGLDILQVPYTSNPEALTDLVGGHVDMMFPDIASSSGHVNSGALRTLATVTMGEPSGLAPDLPLLSDEIVPDLRIVGWIGLFAPADTPDEVVARLSRDVETAVNTPEFKERMAGLGVDANFLNPEEHSAYIANERAQFAAIFERLGMEPQ